VFVGIERDKRHASEQHLWTLSRTVLPHRHVYDFNQALMDFGATVCSARLPRCEPCPMKSKCKTYPFVETGRSRKRPSR
jgi:A/G-specific adenine glycosylase